MPAAARMEVLPSPKGSHARPRRGANIFLEGWMMPRVMPGSPGNSRPERRIRRDRGLHAGSEGHLAIQRVGHGQRHFVAQAQVQGQARVEADVVLQEQAGVPVVVDLGDGRVLLEAGRQAHHEIGQRVAGLLAVEGPHAVVVQRGVLNEFFERSVDAHLEGVTAAHQADGVAHAVVVAARDRSLDGLRQFMKPLTVICGSDLGP